MQKRAIRADALERLLEFGREAFDRGGGLVLNFDKAARRRLTRAAPWGQGAGAAAAQTVARVESIERSASFIRLSPVSGTNSARARVYFRVQISSF